MDLWSSRALGQCKRADRINEEGCLSVPNIRKSITRQRIISIEYINENGTPMACDLKNMDAVIVQHEIDHINGLTILSSRKNRRKFDEPKKSQTD